MRQYYQLNVPKVLVYASLEDVDPNGLGQNKREKGSFTSEGTNWMFSFDGYGKLMGFQNNTFSTAICDFLDRASRKLVWIKVWDSSLVL